MDCFSNEFLEKYLKRSKSKMIDKINKLELFEDDLPIYSDLLCMELNYSPKKIYRNQTLEETLNRKFLIESSNFGVDQKYRGTCSKDKLNFDLQRKTPMPHDEEREEVEGGKNYTCSKRILNSIPMVNTNKKIITNQFKSDRQNDKENFDINIQNDRESKKLNEVKKLNKFSIFYKNNSICINKKISGNAFENASLPSYSNNSNGDKKPTPSNLKIYIKQKKDISTIVNLQINNSNREKTFLDILKFLLEENKLHPKFINFYYFTDHTNRSPSNICKNKNIDYFVKEEDMNDKEIDLNTILKELFPHNENNKEIDLLMRRFPDLPELECLSYYSQYFLSIPTVEDKEIPSVKFL